MTTLGYNILGHVFFLMAVMAVFLMVGFYSVMRTLYIEVLRCCCIGVAVALGFRYCNSWILEIGPLVFERKLLY